MKIIRKVTPQSIIFGLITACSVILINSLFVIEANGSEIKVQLTNPQNGAILTGNIFASAETNYEVSKVEFYFLDESGRFTFTYEGVSKGNNTWEYTWNTDESIDGIYRVNAIAVDGNNSTYISNINRIFVDNAGGSIPDFDQNTNSSPIGNYNVNQNTNTTIIENFNTNSGGNQNTNSIDTNSQIPTNINNPNANSNSSLNFNNNINTDINSPDENNPDSDNDGLTDEEEIEAGTDISNPDSDNDGLIDGFEEKHGFNPLINDNDTPIRTPDQSIIQAITDARFGGSVQSKDTDQDGLPDSVETLFGSDPFRPDTSKDGMTDGFKANSGYSLHADNSSQITKKKIELPNPNIDSKINSSMISTIAIFGTLVLIIIIVLVVFRPKKV